MEVDELFTQGRLGGGGGGETVVAVRAFAGEGRSVASKVIRVERVVVVRCCCLCGRQIIRKVLGDVSRIGGVICEREVVRGCKNGSQGVNVVRHRGVTAGGGEAGGIRAVVGVVIGVILIFVFLNVFIRSQMQVFHLQSLKGGGRDNGRLEPVAQEKLLLLQLLMLLGHMVMVSSPGLDDRFQPLAKLGEGLSLKAGDVMAEHAFVFNQQGVRAKSMLSLNGVQQLPSGLLQHWAVLRVLDSIAMIPHAAVEIPKLDDESTGPTGAGGPETSALEVVVLNDTDLAGDATKEKVEAANASLLRHGFSDFRPKGSVGAGVASAVPVAKEFQDLELEIGFCVVSAHPGAQFSHSEIPGGDGICTLTDEDMETGLILFKTPGTLAVFLVSTDQEHSAHSAVPRCMFEQPECLCL